MSMVPSHICQSPMLFALLHPHTMPDVCFCFCHWWKSGWSFWSVGLRTRHPFFAETSWNVDSSEYSTNFHHLFDYLRCALAQRTRQHRCIELMYSFLLEKQIFKLYFLMQQQTVVNDSGFLKYSWAHVAIFNTAAWRFLMQCHLRAQRSSTFNWGFLPCPTCTVISLDSLNLFTILCMVLDFLFVWHFYREIWHKVMSQHPAFLAKTEMLLLYPNMIPWPITNSPAYCELFQNSLTWIFYNLFTFILPLSQLFWNVLQPSKNKICSYLQNTFTLVSENLENLFFVLLSIK